MEILLQAIETPVIVLVLVFLIYWLMEWLKKVLVKLDTIWIQPISLLVSTILAAFVLYTYDLRPLDLGVAKYALVDFILQGSILAAITGTLYDKIMK